MAFVRQAREALRSGTDFTFQQKTAMHSCYIEIHKAMETVPIELFIPANPALGLNVVACQGTSGFPFRAFLEEELPVPARGPSVFFFQSITCMQVYREHSFEELRLVDYHQDRHIGQERGQDVTRSPTSPNFTNALEELSRRLKSAENENIRLQGEIAILHNSAATKHELSQVRVDLARLRSEVVSNIDYTSKKRKLSSPSFSLPSQTQPFTPIGFHTPPLQPTATSILAPRSSLFSTNPPMATPVTSASLFVPTLGRTPSFGPTLSGSFFGQGSGSSQSVSATNTPSMFGSASGGSMFSQASNVPSLFDAAPNTSGVTPTSTTPNLSNSNMFAASAKVAPPVNMFSAPNASAVTAASSEPSLFSFNNTSAPSAKAFLPFKPGQANFESSFQQASVKPSD
ncbi:MAG: hypothetical protein Q9226_005585 [Calogaya cf. arnoldii]